MLIDALRTAAHGAALIAPEVTVRLLETFARRRTGVWWGIGSS